MNKDFIKMGYNYMSKRGLVRTVCRAMTLQGESMIAFVDVRSGANVSDIFVMSEKDFRDILS